MSGFFGFDTALPERKDALHPQQGFGFQPSNANETFALTGVGAGEEEDLAVYTWGENYDDALLDGGDDFNDETFGGVGDVGKSQIGSSLSDERLIAHNRSRLPILGSAPSSAEG